MEQDIPHKQKRILIICVLLTVRNEFQNRSMLLILGLSSKIFFWFCFFAREASCCLSLFSEVLNFNFCHAARFRLIVVQCITLFYSLFFPQAFFSASHSEIEEKNVWHYTNENCPYIFRCLTCLTSINTVTLGKNANTIIF